MPRQLQTGYGSRKHFQTTTPASFLPPVRHISVQFPGTSQATNSDSNGLHYTMKNLLMKELQNLKCQIPM